MSTPVGSIARWMPFHDLVIWNFCRAVNGNRGSGAGGSGTSSKLLETFEDFLTPEDPPDLLVKCCLVKAQPIMIELTKWWWWWSEGINVDKLRRKEEEDKRW